MFIIVKGVDFKVEDFDMGENIKSYSFYNGTLNKNKKEIIDLINSTDTILYTNGLEYRNPTTYRVPISKDKAIELIESNGLIDVYHNENCLYIQEYSSNDMY